MARDAEPDVAEALRHRGRVLISGALMSGKTRLALQVARAEYAGHTAIRRRAITPDSGPESLGYNAFRLIHTHCQRRLPDGSAGAPVLCSPD